MLYVFSAMLLCLIVAGLVVAFVAYPHRGQTMPLVPWLGRFLGRAADNAPTIEQTEREHERLFSESR